MVMHSERLPDCLQKFLFTQTVTWHNLTAKAFYCVNTSYLMDNLPKRSVHNGLPNGKTRWSLFPPAESVQFCPLAVNSTMP